jgi:hypothetical protein
LLRRLLPRPHQPVTQQLLPLAFLRAPASSMLLVWPTSRLLQLLLTTTVQQNILCAGWQRPPRPCWESATTTAATCVRHGGLPAAMRCAPGPSNGGGRPSYSPRSPRSRPLQFYQRWQCKRRWLLLWWCITMCGSRAAIGACIHTPLWLRSQTRQIAVINSCIPLLVVQFRLLVERVIAWISQLVVGLPALAMMPQEADEIDPTAAPPKPRLKLALPADAPLVASQAGSFRAACWRFVA